MNITLFRVFRDLIIELGYKSSTGDHIEHEHEFRIWCPEIEGANYEFLVKIRDRFVILRLGPSYREISYDVADPESYNHMLYELRIVRERATDHAARLSRPVSKTA